MYTQCHGLTRIPCTLMRGGTSRGAYFRSCDLPEDEALRDQVLLAAMGSPHPLQVDGIGGGQSLTSKVAIIGPPSLPDADVDYQFAQVSVTEPKVDTRASCGNLLAAVGPFAVEHGLVRAGGDEAVVRVHDANTGVICEARFGTPGGIVTYSGEARIDGAPGRAAPIRLTYLNAQGAITGSLFPTGASLEVIDGLAVTVIDYAIPVVIIAAQDLGLNGRETPAEINAQTALLARIEQVRRQAGLLMGLGDVSGRVTPKVALVSPTASGTIVSRYLTPWACHSSHAVTGGMAIAVACTIDGGVPARVMGAAMPPDGMVRIEHPAGVMDIFLSMTGANAPNASILRTARKLFEGQVLIPEQLWQGHRPVSDGKDVEPLLARG